MVKEIDACKIIAEIKNICLQYMKLYVTILLKEIVSFKQITEGEAGWYNLCYSIIKFRDSKCNDDNI